MVTNFCWLDEDAVDDKLLALEATEERDEEVGVWPLDIELPVTEFRLFLELKHRNTVGDSVKFPMSVFLREAFSQF